MIVRPPGNRPGRGPARKVDCNDTDRRYVLEAAAALEPILAACATAAASAGPAVRVLARRTLTEQTGQRAAIAAVLRDWGLRPTARPVTAGEAIAGLQGQALDRVFVERLTAHTHASTADARAEMIAGASRSARLLARHAIHADDRRLAALDVLHGAEARDRDLTDAPPA